MNRYYLKRKPRTLTTESSYVESTYVAKPRYHDKRKSRKLVRWLAYITSDWQRLTVATLIAMLVSGLGTLVVLTLLRLTEVSRPAEPAIITKASAPDDTAVAGFAPESNAQNVS